VNGDLGVKGCKIIGQSIPVGYEKTGEFFVDNSGFGGGVALGFNEFLKEVKAGYYYGIREAGAFQVYIAEFKKINRAKALKEAGIVSSKLVANNTRLTIFVNGDKVLKLHDTDIIKWVGDKIILSSGGWQTRTTKDRLNGWLNRYNTTNYYIYQKKGNWYIKDGEKVLEFFDGIEL